MKEYMKEHRKTVLKKAKQNYKLKSVEVYAVTKFIKDKVESSSNDGVDVDVIYDDDDDDDDDDE